MWPPQNRDARRNADAGIADRGAGGAQRATDEKRDPARDARAGAELKARGSQVALTGAAREHAPALRPRRAARPRTAKPRSRSGAGRETEAIPFASGAAGAPCCAPVRRATRASVKSPLGGLVAGEGRRLQPLRTPWPCCCRLYSEEAAAARSTQSQRGGALQPPHHGKRGGRRAPWHGWPLVSRRFAPGVRLQDAAEHGLERRPGTLRACEGCGGSARPDAAPRAGARRIGYGYHQAHRGRETTRPNRRVRLYARRGGSALNDVVAGIGADIARDSSAKIEWSANMQNFDQVLAGARLSVQPVACAALKCG